MSNIDVDNQKKQFSQIKSLGLTAICITSFTLTSSVIVKPAVASTLTGGMSYSKDGTNFSSNKWTGEYTFKVELIAGTPQQIKITQQSSTAKKGNGSNGWLTFIDVTTDAKGNIMFDQSNVPYYESEKNFKNNKVKFRGRFMGSFDDNPKDLDFKFFPSPDSTDFPKSFWMFTSPTPQDPQEPESEKFQDFSSQPPFVSTPEPASDLSLFILGTLGVVSTLKCKLKSFKSSDKELKKV